MTPVQDDCTTPLGTPDELGSKRLVIGLERSTAGGSQGVRRNVRQNGRKGFDSLVDRRPGIHEHDQRISRFIGDAKPGAGIVVRTHSKRTALLPSALFVMLEVRGVV